MEERVIIDNEDIKDKCLICKRNYKHRISYWVSDKYPELKEAKFRMTHGICSTIQDKINAIDMEIFHKKEDRLEWEWKLEKLKNNEKIYI